MRFGITLFTADRGITPAAAAKAAEEAGFASFYVPEHTHIPASRDTPHPATGGAALPDDRYLRTLDPWVSLATAAQATVRIRLGTCVALPLEHDPIALAKTVATLDFLSGGRVVLGAGFGWNEEELRDHGVDPRRRRDALADYLAAIRALWYQEEASYAGEFVSFGPSWAWPKPAQETLPVLLGAAGTDRSFRWVARHADGWMSTPRDEDTASAVRRLREAWADAGRDGQPEVVVLAGRPDEEQLESWGNLGVDEVVMGLPDRDVGEVLAYVERRARLVERFA